MIDYTDKPAQQEFPTTDDVLAFGRFLLNFSGGKIARLSPEAAADALDYVLMIAESEIDGNEQSFGPQELRFRRVAAVNDLSGIHLMQMMAEADVERRRHSAATRCIAKLAAADIPAVDAIYAIRRVLSEGGE